MSPMGEGETCPACGRGADAYEKPYPHRLPPGTVLMERYLIGRVLGESNFDITYLGCDLRLEKKIVVKEYSPLDRVTRTSATSPAVIFRRDISQEDYRASKERFLQDTRTMAQLDRQPGIVGVRDSFEANNTVYVVMDYIEGTSLKALMVQRGGRIPARELLYITESVFPTLSAIHRAGLVHHNVNAGNLMLADGGVWLLGFRYGGEVQMSCGSKPFLLNQACAPIEQYTQHTTGPYTDVYALAATMYYCLTGKAPPRAVDRLIEDTLIPPCKLGVELTEKQEQALLYAMGIRAKRRYQSMRKFHAALYD